MSAGKGDSPRPVDPVKFRENYDRIFRKVKGCNRHGPNPHPYCIYCSGMNPRGIQQPGKP